MAIFSKEEKDKLEEIMNERCKKRDSEMIFKNPLLKEKTKDGFHFTERILSDSRKRIGLS